MRELDEAEAERVLKPWLSGEKDGYQAIALFGKKSKPSWTVAILSNLKPMATDIQRGRLTLACAPTLAATRLPEILATFQKSYPGVTAHVRELASAEMLDCIRRQDVDFGIGPRALNAASVSVHSPPSHERAPTLSASSKMPGGASRLEQPGPESPAAATVTIPAARCAWIACRSRAT